MLFHNLIFDIDGVFTDGSFLYDETGKKYKRFGAHDSDGIKLLTHHLNLNICAVSADHRGFSITSKRMEDMGISVHLIDEQRRLAWIENHFGFQSTCYMGDGHFDSIIFENCFRSIAPANALERCRTKASFVTSRSGGDGAVYEACIWILKQFQVVIGE